MPSTLLAALLSVALAAPPRAAADEELKNRVEAYLDTMDTPISAERWKALGPGAGPILAALATSETELPTTRARAVSALAAVDGTEGARVGKVLASDPEGHPVVRASALRVLGGLLPPAQLRSAVGPVMNSARPAMVRAAAAEVLARNGGPEACAAVKARIAEEGEEERGKFHRSSTLCR
jgi:hypothetical protein